MAYTSVKISANSSDYQSQMKSAAAQMKVLSAEYTTAATKAKLFGSETDSLKAKAESLTQKITVQKGIVQLNSEQQEKLTKKLSEQKTKQEELKGKIDAAKEAYAKSTEETGKNSEQSKALKEKRGSPPMARLASRSIPEERSESVTCQTLGMNTTQNILTIAYVTFNKCNMMFAVNKTDKSVCLEISVFCRHIHLCGAFNKFVVTFPVFPYLPLSNVAAILPITPPTLSPFPSTSPVFKRNPSVEVIGAEYAYSPTTPPTLFLPMILPVLITPFAA